jgi:hypothetical protein
MVKGFAPGRLIRIKSAIRLTCQCAGHVAIGTKDLTMRMFMDVYPLIAVLFATVAVIFTLTMGHARLEPVLVAVLMSGLLAVPVTALIGKTRL